MKSKKRPLEVREDALTYNDYAELPEEGGRYELVGGVLEAMSPGPSAKHQLVSQEIAFCLKETCHSEYIILHAPIDVILSEIEVRQPDIAMVHRDRLATITKRGIEGPPDLVVEILSPSSVKRDRRSKMKSYAYYEIPEYWIVDPQNQVLEQYILHDENYELKEVYAGAQLVRSERISCVSFSMNEIMSNVPDFPDM